MRFFRRLFAVLALFAVLGGAVAVHHHGDRQHGIMQTDASCAACQALTARTLPPPTVLVVPIDEIAAVVPTFFAPDIASPQIDCLRIAPGTSPPALES